MSGDGTDRDPIGSPEEHERAVADLLSRIGADPSAAALARELARILRFELSHPSAGAVRPIAARLAGGKTPPRRTALISDIHGNHAGLLAVLADIESQA